MKYIKFLLIVSIFIIIKPSNVLAEFPISNRTYVIESAVGANKAIDLYNGETANGTNVQLYSTNNGNNQRWILKLQSDNYYTINSSINENKALDVYRGIQANYTNVQLYDNNNGDNQKWKINYIGNGYVNIVSKGGKYCLDVNGGKSDNKTNIQIFKCNTSNAQKFKLVEVIDGAKTIEDGTYTINSALNLNKALDVHGGNTANGTNVELYQSHNGLNQKWEIKYLNNGYYSISSKLDKNKCLDVYRGTFTPETNVQIYNCQNSDNQKWIIKDAGNGYYYIITPGDHMYLDIYGGLTTNGTNVQIYVGNNGLGQKFKLVKTDTKKIVTGTYTIKTSLNLNKSLDIYSGIIEENKEVKLYTAGNNNNQKWYIEKLENGYYTIKALADSNLYLSGGTTSTKISTSKTEWELIYYDDNKYYIKQKDTNKYLSLANSSTNNGTNLILTTTTSNSSIFNIETTTINNNDRTMPDGYYMIKSSINTNQVLDVNNGNKANNSNVALYKRNNANNQIWYFRYANNGYYYITSAMNPNTALTNSSNNVNLYKLSNSNNQQWKLSDDTKGNKILVSKSNNTCIDLPNGNTSNNTNVQTYTCNNQTNQKFKLEKYTNKKNYTGIDVSQYQGNVDWAKVAASNIGFVILRAGYGDNWTSQDDTKFVRNVQELEKYNIPYGVYLYSYAINVNGSTSLNADSESATSEAEHVLRLLRSVSYKPNLKTSVYLDMEDSYTLKAGKNGLTNIANKFCSIIETNGYGCGVYASTSWLNNNLNTKNIANNYDIWVAEWPYGSSPSPSYTTAFTLKPSYKLTDYRLWQFSSRGSISGISGNVDVDIGYNIFD